MLTIFDVHGTQRVDRSGQMDLMSTFMTCIDVQDRQCSAGL